MPRFDRSGPWGQGPRSGGGFGLCGRGVQPDDGLAPISTDAGGGGRINRRAQRQANRQGGRFMDKGQGGGQGGGQRRSRNRRCWTTGGRFKPNQTD